MQRVASVVPRCCLRHCASSRCHFDAVLDGSLTVRLAGTYPLAEAGKAHEALESRTVQGKLLLVP